MNLCDLKEQRLKITYGTGIFLMISSRNNLEFADGLISTVLYQENNKSKPFYAIEGSIESGANTLSFLRNNLGLSNMWDLDKDIQKDNNFEHSELFLGAFGRIMAPLWRTNNGGFFVNFTSNSTQKDIYRSCLESFAFRIKMCLDSYPSKNLSVNVDGGITNNKYLMRFQSNLLNQDIKCLDVKDCTLLGVAIAAGKNKKFFKNEDQLFKTILGKYRTVKPVQTLTKITASKYRKFLKLIMKK